MQTRKKRCIKGNNTVRKFPKIREDTAIYPDTCYLLSLAKSGNSFNQSVLRLAATGTVIFMSSVIEEFKNNLKQICLKSEVKSRIMQDLAVIQSGALESRNIFVENHSPSEQELAEMRKTMRTNSDKGNERIGAGEASIISHIRAIFDMFPKYAILSQDSDVSYLAESMGNVQVYA